MHILLNDRVAGSAEVEIVMMRVDFKRRHLFLTFEHGETVDGAWVTGAIRGNEKVVRDLEEEHDQDGNLLRAKDLAFSALVPPDLVITMRTLLGHAIAQGWFAGTIVGL